MSPPIGEFGGICAFSGESTVEGRLGLARHVVRPCICTLLGLPAFRRFEGGGVLSNALCSRSPSCRKFIKFRVETRLRRQEVKNSHHVSCEVWKRFNNVYATFPMPVQQASLRCGSVKRPRIKFRYKNCARSLLHVPTVAMVSLSVIKKSFRTANAFIDPLEPATARRRTSFAPPGAQNRVFSHFF